MAKVYCSNQISPWTTEYYHYCCRLLETIDLPVDVFVGPGAYPNTFKLDIQSEHTLVKLGGRSVDEIIWGQIDLLNNEGKYLIRIPNYNYYNSLDGVIEYSLANVINISTNDKFKDYLKRVTYVAPLIYDEPTFDSSCRSLVIFLGNNSDRRQDIINQSNGRLSNVQNVLSRYDLEKLYKKTKIIVNIHQTNEHHTLEELRILPALMRGVIVISEDVPLKDKIPYSDCIVWSKYENILETMYEVENNYNDYRQRIFNDHLKNILYKLKLSNLDNLRKLLKV